MRKCVSTNTECGRSNGKIDYVELCRALKELCLLLWKRCKVLERFKQSSSTNTYFNGITQTVIMFIRECRYQKKEQKTNGVGGTT